VYIGKVSSQYQYVVEKIFRYIYRLYAIKCSTNFAATIIQVAHKNPSDRAMDFALLLARVLPHSVSRTVYSAKAYVTLEDVIVGE